MTPPFAGRRRLAVLALSVIALSIYHVTAVPILAPLLERQFDLSPKRLGLLLSVSMVGGTLGAAAAGWLADRWGRVRILSVATGVTAAGYFLCAAPSALPVFYAGLALAGVGCSATNVACGGLLPALFPERRRGSFTVLLVTGAAAGILLPYPVAYLQGLHQAGQVSFGGMMAAPFVLVGLLLAGLAFWLMRFAPLADPGASSNAPQKPTDAPRSSGRPRRGWTVNGVPLTAVGIVALLATAHGLSDNVLYSWITRHLTMTFDEHPLPPGWVLSFYNAAYLTGRLGLAMLPDQVGRRTLTIVPGLIAGPVMFTAMQSDTYLLTFGGYVLACLFSGLEYPALMGLVAQRFPDRFATVFGLAGTTTLLSVPALWGVGKWAEMAGSTRPPLSAAAGGYVLFALVAALWLVADLRAKVREGEGGCGPYRERRL